MMRNAAVLCFGVAAATDGSNALNKVLELLHNTKNQVQAEGEVEAEQFAAFQEWCSSETDEKQDAITSGEEDQANAEASIEQFTGDLVSLSSQLTELSAKQAADQGDLDAAKKIRADENAEFQKQEKELVEVIDTIVRAASVLRRAGHEGSAGTTATLTNMIQFKKQIGEMAVGLSSVLDAEVIATGDRNKLAALLSAAENDDDDDEMSLAQQPQGTVKAYESHSKGIVDLLAELKIKAEEELQALRKQEVERKHAYELLAQSLTGTLAQISKEVSENKQQAGMKGEAKGVAMADLAETTKTLEADRAYLKDLTGMCSQREAEWPMRQKSRQGELDAINNAIEILSGDDFTTAVANRSFLQQKSKGDVRERVATLLQSTAQKLGDQGLMQLASRTLEGGDPFAKVRNMIENMITRLLNQGAQELNKKAYCDQELATSTAKREKLTSQSDTLSARIDKAAADQQKLKESVTNLSSDIAAMTQAVAKAKEQRAKENKAYNEAIKDYTLAQEKLGQAITVLQEYYSSGKALVQQKEEQPDFGGPMWSGSDHGMKGDSSTGVIGLLETIESDFSRMEADARAEEAASQKNFDKYASESQITLAAKEEERKGKERRITTLANGLSEMKGDRDGVSKELDAVMEYLDKLRTECTHKTQTFAERTAKREQEIESLREALRILQEETAGAESVEFLQRTTRRHH